jgi:hypothetical protein
MATRSKLNWKVLDPLLLILEKEGWTLDMIASDWGISLTTLERHLTQEVLMPAISKHDYPALFKEYDQRLAGGESPKEIRAAFESRGVNWGTFQNRRSQWNKAHRSTPEGHQDTPEVHPSTPYEAEVLTVQPGTPESTKSEEQDTQGHLGTLEGHQEVMEEVHQSVPDAPHIGTDENIPVHPSTPEVHPELSPDDSSIAHPGVPARQDHFISTPMVHPGTPSAEDWELWSTIKARWLEVEKMLSDRQALLRTPGTPGHTQKKTYVFDVRHIGLIEAYAQSNRIELKDVIYLMCEEFFQRR